MEQEITPPTGEIKTNRVELAEKTFFFERHDGSTVYMKEEEAWNFLNGRSKAVGPVVAPPKLIGVSDGRVFQTAVLEAHALHKEGRVEEAMARLRLGETQELEAARGHIERPRNFDTIDRNRQPYSLRGIR